MTRAVPGTHDQGGEAGLALVVADEGSVVAPRRLAAEPIVRPLYGRIAPDERSAGFLAAAAIAERLSRTAGAARLAFGDYLRDLCDELAGAFGGSHGRPTVTCTAADVRLPVGPAITLGLIVEQLVGEALRHALLAGRTGRIAVSFSAASPALELTVEDGDGAMRAAGRQRDKVLLIVRLLVLQLAGTLETAGGAKGGSRCVVTVPRLGAAT
jgi:two-component sensor histidine kinase